MTDRSIETAEELARRLATAGGLREARLQQAAGTLVLPLRPASPAAGLPSPRAAAEPQDRAADRDVSAETSRPISIWRPERRGEETVWVRPAPQPLGDHYAAVREIAAHRPEGPRRVCFFGESAAAGYLYAPHLTPARVLESTLAAMAGPGAWEVVDLARTNERLATLAATAEAAMQLAPDLLVVYAGNNWTLLETPELSPFAPSVIARQRLAAALREGGDDPRAMAEAAARLARRALAGRATAALERIGRAAAEADVPVIVVLPEVNLADWETRQPPALLFGEDAARWHGHLARGLDALAGGDVAAAEAAAWALVELDGGLCPTPFRLLAEAARRDGRDADARDAAISEVDALHYPLMAFLAAPRAGTAERRILAAEAERRGWGAVDLRQVFADATGDVLPGRRLFLDYCHLTREGMKLAMAAVAAEVLRRTGLPGTGLPGTGPSGANAPPSGALADLLQGEPDALRRLLASLPDLEIAPEAEAVAFLGAAVHTAHRHLPVTGRRDLLTHWCRRALETSPGVAAAMLDLADARTAPLPEALTAAQQRNLRSAWPLTLQHGWRWDGADGELLAAMRDTLAEADRPEAHAMDRLLAERRPSLRAGTDLLPRHLAEPLARPFPEAMASAGLAPRATLRCLWPAVGVDLDVRIGQVEVVARRPGGGERGPAAPAGSEGELEVADGGVPSRQPVGTGWRRLRVDPTGERLTLRWSPPADDPEPGRLEHAIRELEEGREALLHQPFGELFSMRPTDRRRGSRPDRAL